MICYSASACRFSRVLCLTALAGAAALLDTARAELVFDQKEIATSISASEVAVDVKFAFTNKGSRPVEILQLEPGCTCTTPKIAKTSYAAGETGEILVHFEPGHRQGVQRMGIVVMTDDPAQRYISLSLVATIPTVLSFAAPSLVWKNGEPLEAKTVPARISSGIAVRDLKLPVRSPRLRTEIQRTGDATFTLKVTPAPDARNLTEVVEVDAVLNSGQVKRANLFVRIP
jgi:hypothetical protein